MQHLFHQLMVLPKIDNVYGPLKKKYNITPEKSLRETYQKIDLVLVQSDPLDYPRFHLPSENQTFVANLPVMLIQNLSLG